MNHIALSRNDFNTLDPIHIETGLGIVVAVCLILAVALVVLVVWLSKPTLKPTKKTNRGRHDASTGTSIWHERINDVVDRHANGDLGREEAVGRRARGRGGGGGKRTQCIDLGESADRHPQQKAQQQQFLHLPNTRFRPHRKNLFSPLTDSRDGDGCGGGYSARHRPE